jgi:tRNA threonylcarbamoyladenosine biosynthesis protein TsaE
MASVTSVTGKHIILQTGEALETQTFGEKLARLLSPGHAGTGTAGPDMAANDGNDGYCLALAGDLGSGKTTFTQGLARGLGVRAAVTSPTFTLINQYRTADGRLLQHVDCYRLSNAPLEMWDVGLGDLFAGGDIVVIEWADRISGLLPDDYLEITFRYLDDSRRELQLSAHGARYERLLQDLLD